MVIDLDVLLYAALIGLGTMLLFSIGILCLLKESIKKGEKRDEK